MLPKRVNLESIASNCFSVVFAVFAVVNCFFQDERKRQLMIKNHKDFWSGLMFMAFGLGVIVVPINIIVILASFITNADATLTTIGSMCVRDVPIGTEPPAKIKLLWGVSIGIIAIVMAAFGGGAQGVDGVKALAAIAGSVVLFIFAIQVVSFIKVFFIDKVNTEE